MAASLANGISTVEMCRIFTGQEYASVRFDPESLMRPAFKEYLERATMLPAVLTKALLKMFRHPGSANISELGKMNKSADKTLAELIIKTASKRNSSGRVAK